jgi:predicted Holliday junction resolvase-like endonuclease
MDLALPNRPALRQQILSSPDEIRRVLKEDPALAEYVLNDIDLKRKYVKMDDKLEQQLEVQSKQLGLAEGVLLGLGVALLIALLAEAFNPKRR